MEQEKEARKKAEMEAARARLNYQMALGECNQMKQALEQQKQQLEVFRSVCRDVQNTCLVDRIYMNPSDAWLWQTFSVQKKFSSPIAVDLHIASEYS